MGTLLTCWFLGAVSSVQHTRAAAAAARVVGSPTQAAAHLFPITFGEPTGHVEAAHDLTVVGRGPRPFPASTPRGGARKG